MRIIAGQFRGRVLRSPPSTAARPTSDRLRETLFNILAPRIHNTRFLDLCAGTGAIGIEALSRGASFATFVERSRKLCALIEANLDLCEVPEENTEVVSSDTLEFFRRRQARDGQGWDICFYDPPYKAAYLQVLNALGAEEATVIQPGGILIAEHHHKNVLPDEAGALRRWRIVKQGESSLSFYERA